MMEKPWKLVVVGIAFKRVKSSGAILIMTQLRIVQNKEYDPLYDRTWEGIGETVKNGESVFVALLCGLKEEFGDEHFQPVAVYGANKKIWTTGKGDQVHAHEPLCF